MRAPDWQTADGAVQLYLGDCLELLPLMGPQSVDAVVTDPPYGIGEAAGKNKSRGRLAVAQDYGNLDWDNEPASREAIDECRRVSRWQVIFGGNYFHLPPASCWLVWDKMNGESDFADCELAWTNIPKAVRKIAFRWNGMLRDEVGARVHPTQKPIEVMRWAMSWLPASTVVLDPYFGSATTGIACIRTNRRFIGIERERAYFDIAVKRIEAELSKCALFEPPPQIIRQQATLGF